MASGLPLLLDELGLDADQVLRICGVTREDLSPQAFLPFDYLLILLERAAAETGLGDLGLRLGLRFTFAVHGILGELMQSAPTLHQALLDFVSWQPGYSSGAIAYLRRLGDRHALGYDAYAHHAPGSEHLYLGVMGVAYRMVQLLTAGAVQPEEVHIAARQPRNASVIGRWLPVPIRFNQSQTCIILDSALLSTPLPTRDANRRRQLLNTLEEAARLRHGTTAARMRHVLRPLLQSGRPGMPAVAAELGLHTRTLRRHLAAEGQTFERIRDEVRFVMARELLELTDLPISEIADTLAFASPGIFSEAFRRWSGFPPSRWRATARPSPGLPPSSRFPQ